MFDAAPQAVAPYSHAVEVDGWVFITGQLPNDPADDAKPLPEGIEAQTRAVMDNLCIVLNELGLGLGQVTQARVFLTHFKEDYEVMNDVYAAYFASDKRPARTCIGVTDLARGARVEIDMIARRP
jgi:reactive intermediate/imine deaminase